MGVRHPAVAGRFYPFDPAELREMVEWCFSHRLGPGMPGPSGGDRRIVGAMAPHAGYMCSGMNAAHVYREIAEDGLPEAYVVIGPDHYGLSPGVTLCSSSYLTPFGECPVHEGILDALREHYPDVPSAHSREHSVEVQVPFIQYIDPDARIVPIVMGDQSPESARALSSAVEEACRGVDAVVLASTDMSHYVPKPVAERLDGMVLDRVAAMDAEGMYETVARNRVSMCGYGPTAVAMMCSRGAEASVLKHTDSYDALGFDRESVVGYASAVFRHR